MVSKTFENLAEEKQLRIRHALLKEFSTYSLAEAQVARIVADSGIARGAFYKYFKDLTDAYNYVLGVALYEIHRMIPETPTVDNVETYISTIEAFVLETDKTGYRGLMTQHYRYNEGFLGNEPTKLMVGDNGPEQWAITVLYHQTIRDIILDPDTMTERITQLRTILTGKH